ncbi:hypothetical protein KAR91_60250 [Candidatus Pacearchaeota archaeon]|nr:hypothetical protein [Candidatus Pacearchaeota archaeon]
MAVDTQLKRQSATCILLPFNLIGVYGSTSGVNQAERQGVTWSYSGILAAGAVAAGGFELMMIILIEEDEWL